MVINNLDIIGAIIFPAKTYPPLLIDTDTMKPQAVSGQPF
jgi:hypothetical protein